MSGFDAGSGQDDGQHGLPTPGGPTKKDVGDVVEEPQRNEDALRGVLVDLTTNQYAADS